MASPCLGWGVGGWARESLATELPSLLSSMDLWRRAKPFIIGFTMHGDIGKVSGFKGTLGSLMNSVSNSESWPLCSLPTGPIAKSTREQASIIITFHVICTLPDVIWQKKRFFFHVSNRFSLFFGSYFLCFLVLFGVFHHWDMVGGNDIECGFAGPALQCPALYPEHWH